MMAFALTPAVSYIIRGPSPSVRSVFQVSDRSDRLHHARPRPWCINRGAGSFARDELAFRSPRVHTLTVERVRA